jgi:CRP-like cAMP-binding protein
MTKEALLQFYLNTNLVSLLVAQEIVKHFSHKIISKNQLFLAAGKISDEYLFLENGYMRAFAYDTDGNDITTAFCSPGDLVLEVASFFNRTRSKENIQALTDCEGWYITYESLNGLFHELPQFREIGRSVLVKILSDLKNRMLITITESAEERYRELLKTNPGIFQHASLKNIASYLGITDTSLSRIRKELAMK